MATPAERKALNESAFRDANETLEAQAREVLADDDASPAPFFCECPRPECTEVVLLTLDEYEAVRANPRGGLSAVGHVDGSIERVVEENDRFVVTEKFGEAGEVHAEHDPRRDDERVRRIGENEALYRHVNESVERINQSLGTVSGVFDVVCECGTLECNERIAIPRELYEQVRANPARFIIKPGHEFPEAEHVVTRDDGYFVVHKDPGPAQRVAEETDTRT